MMSYDRKSLGKISSISVLASTASYISIVVLALHISENVSLISTAVVIAIPSIIRAFSGCFLNRLTKIVRKEVLFFLSIVVSSLCFFSYIVVNRFILFLVVAVFSGFSELVYQPVAKEMFSISALNEDGVDYVYRIRYLTICIAGLVGPAIGGIVLRTFGSSACFALSGLIYFVALVPAYSFFKRNQLKATVCHKQTVRLQEPVIKNYFLWGYIVSGFLVYLVFSQFESVYSLALETTFPKPAEVYSILLCLNSLFGILLQAIFMHKRFKFKKLLNVNWGVVFFQIGYALFALSFFETKNAFAILIIGVLIYSIGEVITIPQLDIQIERFAPDELKSEFFSLAELRTLGFVLGPILMSIVLENSTAVFSCLINILILFLSLWVNKVTTKKVLIRGE